MFLINIIRMLYTKAGSHLNTQEPTTIQLRCEFVWLMVVLSVRIVLVPLLDSAVSQWWVTLTVSGHPA